MIFTIVHSPKGWKESVIQYFDETNGSYATGNLVWDDLGNLYGTATGDITNHGSVFSLSPSRKGWKLVTIHASSGSAGGYAVKL